MRLLRSLTRACALAATASLACAVPAIADGPSDDPSGQKDVRRVSLSFSPQEISVMARTSGRTEAQQRSHLTAQAEQNNTYAALAESGYRFDGAFFDSKNRLVVQAKAGSRQQRAAERAGLTVRTSGHGETALIGLTDRLSEELGGDSEVVSIAPDVSRDSVVVTVTDKAGAAAKRAERLGGGTVTVVQGERVQSQAFQGGDKMMIGGGYCSAGFPAHDNNGVAYMIWAGHCVEGVGTGVVKTAAGATVGRAAASSFHSYDGKPDKDHGVIALSSSMARTINSYGARQLDASKGAWRAPVGTDMCKSGATSGISCGKVTGYGASVTYTDEQGRVQAQVSGLGTSTVCTAPGDSGGSFVASGYAVGMTSGGPSGQSCGFNGGYLSGKSSYFQPVNDALSAYGLTYGPGSRYNG